MRALPAPENGSSAVGWRRGPRLTFGSVQGGRPTSGTCAREGVFPSDGQTFQVALARATAPRPSRFQTALMPGHWKHAVGASRKVGLRNSKHEDVAHLDQYPNPPVALLSNLPPSDVSRPGGATRRSLGADARPCSRSPGRGTRRERVRWRSTGSRVPRRVSGFSSERQRGRATFLSRTSAVASATYTTGGKGPWQEGTIIAEATVLRRKLSHVVSIRPLSLSAAVH